MKKTTIKNLFAGLCFALLVPLSMSAQKYHLVEQTRGTVKTGVDYVLYCPENATTPYANAKNGMGDRLADDSYLWRFEEATGETTEDGYQLYVLYSVSRQAYWQEQDFENNLGLDGYDIFGYAGVNATFGAKATAMRVAVMEANSTGDWRSFTNTGTGFLISRNNLVPQNEEETWAYTLSFQGQDLAFAPWAGENRGWEIWTVEENTPKEKLEELIDRIVNEGATFQAGDGPGFYDAAAVDRFYDALEAAQNAVAAGTASDDEYIAMYDELEAAEIAVKSAWNKFTDGYYFIVSAGSFFDTQGVEKGVYASNSTTPGWKTIDNCIENKDYSFLWKLTETSDANYKLQNVLYGTYYAGPTTASHSVACVLNESGNVTVSFDLILSDEIGENDEKQWYIYDSFSHNKMHANGHGGGAGQSSNLVTWNAAYANSASAWYIRPVTDEEYIKAAGENLADITINEKNFPDEIFRNWLLGQDYGVDGIITKEEIENITNINVSKDFYTPTEEKISTLEGIQYFTALEYLDCSYNQLTDLDVSNNTALKYLDCYYNNLTSLDVTNNIELLYFRCGWNHLTSLDISHNTALTTLDCGYNELTSLDIFNHKALINFDCTDNKLTTLDISNNTALIVFSCQSNQLASLDVSKNTALRYLGCNINQLTSLDVSKNTALTDLYCYQNQLTTLDVSKNTALTNLHCFGNLIYGDNMDNLIESLPSNNGEIYIYENHWSTEYNVCTKSQVAAIKEKGWTPLYYNGTNWVEYDGYEELVGIEINEKNFPDENFRAYLLEQNYGEDGVITDAEIAGVKSIDISNKQLASLEGIQHFTALTSLDCRYNKLTTLDLSNNTKLTYLDCSQQSIAKLNISGCMELETLWCNNNQLTTLDVSDCSALKLLYCYNNQLTTLDVSNCTMLKSLECSNNQLTALNVTNNTALTILYCHDNKLTTLDASNCKELTTLYCFNNLLTTLNVSGCTMLTDLHCENNLLQGDYMDNFIATLPIVSASKVYIFDKANDDNNICTKEQVAAIKTKGWIPYYSNGNSWQEYEGSDDPTGIDATEMSNGDEIGANIVAYDLNGNRVEGWQSKKGVYIIGGKKIVVK